METPEFLPAALNISSEKAVPTISFPPYDRATWDSFLPNATQYTEILFKVLASNNLDTAITLRSYVEGLYLTIFLFCSSSVLSKLNFNGIKVVKPCVFLWSSLILKI
jgi:hypothetical protein